MGVGEGSLDVYADVVEATLEVASVMLLGAGNSALGMVSSERIDNYSVSFSLPGLSLTGNNVPRALAPAAPYKLKRFGVG